MKANDQQMESLKRTADIEEQKRNNKTAQVDENKEKTREVEQNKSKGGGSL